MVARSFFGLLFKVMLCCAAGVSPQALCGHSCGEAILQLGWFTASQGKSQHIDIDGLVGDHFNVHKSTDNNFLVGAGYYFAGAQLARARLMYGVNAFYLAPTEVTGHVKQEDLYTNLSYRYTRVNYPIYVGAKALIPFCGCNDLVIDVGIGPNIVNIRNFKERSLDGGVTLADSHIFASKSVAAFSATVGIGWRLGRVLGRYAFEVDYRYFYLGQGELKKANSQLRNTLRSGNSYGNALLFSFSI